MPVLLFPIESILHGVVVPMPTEPVLETVRNVAADEPSEAVEEPTENSDVRVEP